MRYSHGLDSFALAICSLEAAKRKFLGEAPESDTKSVPKQWFSSVSQAKSERFLEVSHSKPRF